MSHGSTERTELPARRLPRAQGPPAGQRGVRGLSVVVMGAIASAFWLTERSMGDVEARAAKVGQGLHRRRPQHRAGQQHEGAAAARSSTRRSWRRRWSRRSRGATCWRSSPTRCRRARRCWTWRWNRASRGSPAPPADRPRREEEAAAGKDANAGPPPAAPVQYDVYLKLTGIADTDVQVAQFMAKLSACPLVNDVNLVITDEFKQERPGDAPVPDRDDPEPQGRGEGRGRQERGRHGTGDK